MGKLESMRISLPRNTLKHHNLLMGTKIDLKYEKDKMIVEFVGDIDAKTEFPNLARDAVRELVIDLSALGFINSGGVRSWISWIAAVNNALRGVAITFVNIPSISVRQAAQIKDFLPNGANIQSFVVPYYCDGCQTNTKVIYKNGVNWSSSWNQDEKLRKITYTKCPQCGAMIEIDAVPEHYQNF
jgi:anti-anti-sigma regulatory factor